MTSMDRSPLVRELIVLTGFLAVASAWFGARRGDEARSLAADEGTFKRVRIVDERGVDRIVLEMNKFGQGQIRGLGTDDAGKAIDNVLVYGTSSGGGSLRVLDVEGRMKSGMDAGNWPLGTLWVWNGTFEMASDNHIPRVVISSKDGGRIQLFGGQISGAATAVPAEPGRAKAGPVDLRVEDGCGVLRLGDRNGKELRLEPPK
jgi:hypothetical protein